VSDGTFYAYVVFLIISGILLAVLAGVGLGQSRGARVVNGLFAAGFLAYGLYLLLVFDGGEVHIFFYAFIVPILALVRMIQARNARKSAASVPPTAWPTGQPAPGYAPNATGYPVPGQAAQGYVAPGYPAPGQETPGYPQHPGQPQQPAPYGQQSQPPFPPHNGPGQPPAADPTRGWS
jgi:hypothetical protein